MPRRPTQATYSFIFLVQLIVALLMWRRTRSIAMVKMLVAHLPMLSKARRIWMHERSRAWWIQALESFSDEQWIEHFRLSRQAFNRVFLMVEEQMRPEERCVREPVSAEMRVAIAIYQLSSSCEFRTTGNVFGVHKTTVHRYFHRLCKALCGRKGEVISMPDNQEAQAMAQTNFQRNGFPQAYAAIDGCHIHIKPPRIGLRDYINRKQYPSLVLQGVVDHRYRFRDISVKMPGSVHDAAVLRSSGIYNNQEMLPEGPVEMNGVTIPLLVLGDAAYPMIENFLMRPYVGYNLTPQQQVFNTTHSRSRVCVENCFGRLKSRFRILKKQLDLDVAKAPLVIAACCILNNICEESQIPAPRLEPDRLPQPTSLRQQRLPNDSLVRATISSFLWQQHQLQEP